MIITYISIIKKRRFDTIVLLNQQPASILGTKVVYSFPFSNKNWTPCSVSYIWCYHNGFALCFLSYVFHFRFRNRFQMLSRDDIKAMFHMYTENKGMNKKKRMKRTIVRIIYTRKRICTKCWYVIQFTKE